MIERIIEASARNQFLVFIFTLFAVAAGIYGALPYPARRHSGPERHRR